MAGKRRKKIREPEITGLKYFKKLLPLLERLHDDRGRHASCGSGMVKWRRSRRPDRKPTLRTYEMICCYFCGKSQRGRTACAHREVADAASRFMNAALVALKEDRHGGLSYLR
jgi:hypothetical protein